MKRNQSSLTAEGIAKGCIEEFLASRGFEHIVNADADTLKKAYFAGANQKVRVVAPAYAIVHADLMRQ